MAITPEEKEVRKDGLFSSDIGRIMTGHGVQVALDKLGRLQVDDEFDEKQEFKIGRIAEPFILDAYEDLLGCRVERNIGTIMHPEISWMGCHQDARWQRNVEAKTVRKELRHFWGDGADQVHDYVLWQSIEQMAVSNTMETDIPVCFLTLASVRCLLAHEPPPITLFHIKRDFELEAYMIRKATFVWDCIQAGITPPAENLNDIKLIYARGEDPAVEATPEIYAMYEQLLIEQAAKKTAEQKEDELKFQIQLYMQKSNALVLKDNGRPIVTWRNDSDSDRFDRDAFEQDHPDLFKQYLKPKTGARKFLLKRSK